MNESSKSGPAYLTEDTNEDHYSILQDFYSCFHLQDIREILWDWLVAALSTESGAYSTGYARSNLIFVYERLLLLVEAANEINRRRKKKQKRKRSKHGANLRF